MIAAQIINGVAWISSQRWYRMMERIETDQVSRHNHRNIKVLYCNKYIYNDVIRQNAGHEGQDVL